MDKVWTSYIFYQESNQQDVIIKKSQTLHNHKIKNMNIK